MSRKFLVCIDESIQGRSAFDTALSFTKTEVDLLILANIRPSSEQRLYQFGFDLSSFEAGENEPSEITLQEMEKALGGRSQAILYHYAGKAKAAGVVNVKLLSIISDAVGPSICDLAVEEAAEVLVLGRRGMGTQRRERLGGTAQYVMQHAHCAVVLAPERDGPAEAHVAKKFIIYQEEVERRRRVTEHEEEEKNVRTLSNLNREITVLEEEEERRLLLKEKLYREQLKSSAAAAAAAVAAAGPGGLALQRLHHYSVFQ